MHKGCQSSDKGKINSSFLFNFFMSAFLISAHQVLVILYSTRTFPDISQGKIIPLMTKCPFLLLPQLLRSIHVKDTQLLNTQNEISFAFKTFAGSMYQRPLGINNCQKPHSPVTALALSDALEAMFSLPQVLVFTLHNLQKLWQSISSLEPVACFLQKS